MKAAAFLVVLLAACQRDEMADVPRFEPLEASSLFADGASARVPPPGTVARDSESDSPVPDSPLPFTATRLERGRELFSIHCAPCHGADGHGEGIVVRRGFPHPPTYHSDRLRGAPDGHFFDVITRGYGKMYPFAGRIAVTDRWAIVGYIRALQLSQHASPADVTDGEARTELERSDP